MPLYLAIDAASKARLRQSLTQNGVEPIGEGEEMLVIPDIGAEPDESVYRYDPTTMNFTLVAAPVVWSRTKISKREFRNRLGQTVRLQILGLRNSSDPQYAQVKLLLEDMKETLDSVGEVDLENPDTIAGVNGLASLGLLSAQDVARILAPSTVEAE